MRLALRIGRSRSIWEDGTTSEIAKKEFRGKGENTFDERPSVYLVDPAEIVRAVAEHVVQPKPSIQKHADELDLTGLGLVEPKVALRFFDFTNERHAEVVVDGQRAVLKLVEALQSEPSRRRRRSASAIESYVIDRLSANDPEWVSFMNSRPDWQRELVKWLRPRGA
jgi:hypothetical protein